MLAVLGVPTIGLATETQAGQSHIEAALTNTVTLQRPGEEGLATVWDGNRYVQCLRKDDLSLHCEAAGALMQPSLARLLTPAKLKRLTELGWREDTHFGNYVQTFRAKAPVDQVAARILQTLAEVYDADVEHLEVGSDWTAIEPCPPRNGPSQNLAGMINDAPSMAATAVHACAYTPELKDLAHPQALSAEDVVSAYGARVKGELQRLRINTDRRIFFTVTTESGYLQCEPLTSPAAIYCEAVSADSWPVIASILTPERLTKLHAAGYSDPGRAPNYWKLYPMDKVDDAAIAKELLTILHDVYGYTGWPLPEFTNEKSD
ncbi:MAG TPA: hypothetical protein VHY34_07965 [Caulobacteraceae bacterium]|jgi:hypothetical protein|nr:hypothetical protein [Caulobacteraceae bacterium]